MHQDTLPPNLKTQLFDIGNGVFTTSLVPILIITALASANRPSQITNIAKEHLETLETREDKKKWVMMAQSALIKAAFLCGIPRVINAMQSLMHGVDEETKSSLPKSPSDAGTNLQERGETMFNKVYGKVSERVKSNIGGSSPDLMAIILEDVYGRVLSDVTLLDEVETELLTIVVLVPLHVPAQLKGHLHGAKNVGATEAQVKAAEAIGQLVTDYS
ncbi:hypothetical protein INT44_000563 [Umbelopsis vinacea]|uniref:Carboxymuconolactone decarboxylase-like domain-containing protein n=1 Tax=Umbelopsis vinacea TaxID=44442 RepID=A0A8H7PKZ6_9FUNG|nr:hypothetical protein INT44_000563 [Umbelopsis vinacea]